MFDMQGVDTEGVYFPGQEADILKRLHVAAMHHLVSVEDLVYAAERLASIASEGARPNNVINEWLESMRGFVVADHLASCGHAEAETFQNVFADARQCLRCGQQLKD
jgi:hypothetical protein